LWRKLFKSWVIVAHTHTHQHTHTHTNTHAHARTNVCARFRMPAMIPHVICLIASNLKTACMCVGVYSCVAVCMCVCVRACVAWLCVCLSLSLSLPLSLAFCLALSRSLSLSPYVCVRVCLSVSVSNLSAFVRICLCLCPSLYVSVSMSVFLCVCVYVCMCACVCLFVLAAFLYVRVCRDVCASVPNIYDTSYSNHPALDFGSSAESKLPASCKSTSTITCRRVPEREISSLATRDRGEARGNKPKFRLCWTTEGYLTFT